MHNNINPTLTNKVGLFLCLKTIPPKKGDIKMKKNIFTKARKIIFRGQDCYLFTTRKNIPNNPKGYFRYDMRHHDYDWTKPLTLENKVWVNYYGSIFSPVKLIHENKDYSLLTTKEQSILKEET